MKHGSIMRQKASVEIFNYWEGIRGADDAPMRADVDPAAIRHILPQIFILEKASDGALRFRLAGTMVCNLFGRELRGDMFMSLWSADHSNVVEATARYVMDEVAPVIIDAAGCTRSERNIGFEIALLPLRSSKNVCDRLIGCIATGTSGAWVGSDLLVHLMIDRIYSPRERPTEQMPEIASYETSAWSWTRHVLGF